MPPSFTGVTATNAGMWKPAQPSAHLPRGSWWKMFGDPELNRLEGLATTNNQQLAAAFANFQQARALVGVARADYFPQLSADPSYNRQRISANQSRGAGASSHGSTFNTFSVPLDASWELDVWGRVRREVEGARDRLTASADDLESTKLAIQAEVAIDYFTLRSLDAQYNLLEETAVAYRRSLELTQNRRNGGIATELDVSLAETQLATTEAQVPSVQLQRATFLHALAVLCGQPAPAFELGATRGALGADQKAFDAGPGIPVAVPSELLERRPDIASAERLMAAANADVGLAYAAFYPRITLNGLAGFQSVDANTLFNWESRVWSVGPSLSLPLFTGGRNRAQLAGARAAYDAAVANYRQTVLSAFQDVEDQLSAQHLLAQQSAKEGVALNSARRTVDISMTKYKGGVITYLDVVVAQSAALSLEQTVVQLSAQRLSASVSLIKALGAGWTIDAEPVTASARQK
jgi:multidrug efflux system outer membrane protein